jgi:CheY-like chemotaxis protein
MDVMMPEMDGYEAISKLKEIGINPNVPIIAVTAKAMKGDREKCLEAGATDYISKPLDLKELLEKMSKALNQE